MSGVKFNLQYQLVERYCYFKNAVALDFLNQVKPEYRARTMCKRFV